MSGSVEVMAVFISGYVIGIVVGAYLGIMIYSHRNKKVKA